MNRVGDHSLWEPPVALATAVSWFLMNHRSVFDGRNQDSLFSILEGRQTDSPSWERIRVKVGLSIDALIEVCSINGSPPIELTKEKILLLASFPSTLESFMFRGDEEGYRQHIDMARDHELDEEHVDPNSLMCEFKESLDLMRGEVQIALVDYGENVHQLMVPELHSTPLGKAILDRGFVNDVQPQVAGFLEEFGNILDDLNVGLKDGMSVRALKKDSVEYKFHYLLEGLKSISDERVPDSKGLQALLTPPDIAYVTFLYLAIIGSPDKMSPEAVMDSKPECKALYESAEKAREAYNRFSVDLKAYSIIHNRSQGRGC